MTKRFITEISPFKTHEEPERTRIKKQLLKVKKTLGKLRKKTADAQQLSLLQRLFESLFIQLTGYDPKDKLHVTLMVLYGDILASKNVPNDLKILIMRAHKRHYRRYEAGKDVIVGTTAKMKKRKQEIRVKKTGIKEKPIKIPEYGRPAFDDPEPERLRAYDPLVGRPGYDIPMLEDDPDDPLGNIMMVQERRRRGGIGFVGHMGDPRLRMQAGFLAGIGAAGATLLNLGYGGGQPGGGGGGGGVKKEAGRPGGEMKKIMPTKTISLIKKQLNRLKYPKGVMDLKGDIKKGVPRERYDLRKFRARLEEEGYEGYGTGQDVPEEVIVQQGDIEGYNFDPHEGPITEEEFMRRAIIGREREFVRVGGGGRFPPQGPLVDEIMREGYELFGTPDVEGGIYEIIAEQMGLTKPPLEHLIKMKKFGSILGNRLSGPIDGLKAKMNVGTVDFYNRVEQLKKELFFPGETIPPEGDPLMYIDPKDMFCEYNERVGNKSF
jgi:hypothetical protein